MVVRNQDSHATLTLTLTRIGSAPVPGNPTDVTGAWHLKITTSNPPAGPQANYDSDVVITKTRDGVYSVSGLAIDYPLFIVIGGTWYFLGGEEYMASGTDYVDQIISSGPVAASLSGAGTRTWGTADGTDKAGLDDTQRPVSVTLTR